MTAYGTARTPRVRRWVRAGFFVVAVAGAAFAALVWRPVTVLSRAYDCRLHVLPQVRTFLSATQPEQGGIPTVTVPW